MPKGYCLKCRKMMEIKNSKEVTMAGGRKALKGECPVCGTAIYRILGKEGK